MSSGCVKWHLRTPDWYARRRAQTRHARAGLEGRPIRVDLIAARDHLFQAAVALRRDGGPGAGPDGATWADIGPSETGVLCGTLSRVILAGEYRPGPTRCVKVPKASGGTRTLRIGNIADRIVGKAVDIAFKNFWETRWHDRSFGFRRGRGVWDLLALLDADMARTGRRVIAVHDIRTAFDTVPIEAVVECHRNALGRVRSRGLTPADVDDSVRLVETVLRGHDQTRTRGIDQGHPYGPAALNVLLHNHHDTRVGHKLNPELPWFRYADNLAYLCQCMPEAQAVPGQVGRLLLPPGMALRRDGTATDLGGGGTTELLGVTLSWSGGELRFGVGDEALLDLALRLDELQAGPSPSRTTADAVYGWAGAYGPALENGGLDRLLAVLAKTGVREFSRDRLRQYVRRGWERWLRLRARCRKVRV